MSLIDQFIEWLRPRAAKSWPLENQIQAQALSGILTEEGIFHRIRRNGEALWGYAEQVQEGWGRLEVEDADIEAVETIYREFLESEAGDPENGE